MISAITSMPRKRETSWVAPLGGVLYELPHSSCGTCKTFEDYRRTLRVRRERRDRFFFPVLSGGE